MTSHPYQTVLITGCSSGIGACLAKKLHEQGHNVLATARNKEKLSELQNTGISTFSLDVTSQQSIDELVQTLSDQNTEIQAIINNAGYAAMGPMAELPMEDLEKQLSTNVTGIVRVVQAFSKDMITKKAGLIVNIGSVSGILTTPFSGAYCASKAAVHCLTDAMRMELSPFNINVVDVRPGAIESSFGDNAAAGTEKNKQNFKLYQSIYQQIMKRANASQDNPTPTDEFCDKLIDGCFTNTPKPIQYIGNGSTAFPLMKRLLPTKLLDQILCKKFGLNQL
ncbi:SDR family oxidoreductase [Litoribacillus peritrichatus]|uniref:SDR family oxidoreductase n=1 Tax=Litoribacillus peritrichatus TaxID=718191 RepID=A0ABP7LZH1_9GAMM